MSKLKKIKTIEIDVFGYKDQEFPGCANCKYADIPEASCRAMGCVHVFDRFYDFFEREKKDGMDKSI